MTWMLRKGALAFAVGVAALAASAVRAQEPETQPPRVVSLPAIELPDGEPAPPDGRVEVTIVVAADGSATVEQCDAGDTLGARVGPALAAARFEPARRAGEPIPARVRITLQITAPPPPEPPRPTTPDAGVPTAPIPVPAPPASDAGPAEPPDDAPTAAFGATARVAVTEQPGM